MKRIDKLLWVRIFFGTLTFMTCAVIFYMSSENATLSSNRSEGLSSTIINAIASLFGFGHNNTVIIDRFESILRKIAHMSSFMTLSAFCSCFLLTFSFKDRIRALICAGFCILYAISDEVHQLFVSGRAGQVSDVMIDSIGVIIGILLVLSAKRIFLFFKKEK